MDKLQIIVKPLEIIYQPILSYQKQLSKMIQSGGFHGRLLGPLPKITINKKCN